MALSKLSSQVAGCLANDLQVVDHPNTQHLVAIETRTINVEKLLNLLYRFENIGNPLSVTANALSRN